ncbi:hypothetical protein M569_09151 [Genlisea aurea]|uniref:Uncharacterized protein n=1 Tax=Genlisea aurea TaxID=192259 RepID=S8CFF8_9LAMI|nr:hypothetical protein M569_09151 [Genlisea aurea]
MARELEEFRSPSAAAGLIISSTVSIRTFLTAASSDSALAEDLREMSASLAVQSTVPYESLRRIWFGSGRDVRPSLSMLLSGSNFVFTSPKPREKSKELQLMLEKLEEAAERKAYQKLVQDITPPRTTFEEPFSSYKDQLGFGMHVVVAMFTGYLVGYAAFRALLGNSAAMSAAGGILGLVLAMLVETLLFIIRSSTIPSSSPSSIKMMSYKKNQ